MVGTYNAFPGILSSDKDPIRIVDDPQRFTDEVVEFLNSPALRSECGLRARELVQQHCRWGTEDWHWRN